MHRVNITTTNLYLLKLTSCVHIILQVFSATGCFRIVLVMPDDKIAQACTRIKDFCREHYINHDSEHNIVSSQIHVIISTMID